MILLFIILTVASAHSEKEYAALEKTFSKPFEYRVDADIWIDEKPFCRSGKLYLFDDEILFVSSERMNTHIPYSDLIRVTVVTTDRDHSHELKLFRRVHVNINDQGLLGIVYITNVADAEQLCRLIESHMRSAWQFAVVGTDGNTELFRENIFAYQWNDTGETAEVIDPLYGQKHVFKVFRVSINGIDHEFAAGEFSNCVWGFFVKDCNC